ncbi:MAG: Fic family protein [Bacteroidetes bacterium]|nr:Fic family protein [Bacteroidota bacterium]
MKSLNKISSKYQLNTESEFQQGTRNKILKNIPGVKKKSEIDKMEIEAYINAENILIRKYDKDHRFDSNDIHYINKIFLGKIYDWAGKLRDVNISKGGFLFTSAFALPQALNEFEINVLKKNTPCKGDLNKIISQIAEVHTELLILHPYREGNGRTARLLATVMSYQAGNPGIDFGFIGSKGKEFNNYILAVQSGMDRNYKPMENIIERGIKLALKKFAKD